MKVWILSFTVIIAAAGTVTWLLVQRTVPRMLANANEEMVADWREGLLQRRRETGTWPRRDTLRDFMDDIYHLTGSDGHRIPDGYMHGRPSKNNGAEIVDVFDTPLKFTFEGDTCRVLSAGPNRVFGDADDISSDTARDRYIPSPAVQAPAAGKTGSRSAPASTGTKN